MILITGASSGIGAACAKLFAKKGQPLILWARRQARLETLKRELLELGSPQVEIATIDVRDAQSIEREVAGRGDLYAQTDVLINNAGMASGLLAFQDSKISDFDQMVDTNIKGILYVTHAILPFLIKKNHGHIINLGSVASRWTYPKGHTYCATKAAVKSISEGLRFDLNGTAIRVTEISPGMVETEFSEVRLGDAAKAKAIYQGMTPLTAVDIAEAIGWAVERPAHVNIQEIVIYPAAQASPTVVSRKT